MMVFNYGRGYYRVSLNLGREMPNFGLRPLRDINELKIFKLGRGYIVPDRPLHLNLHSPTGLQGPTGHSGATFEPTQSMSGIKKFYYSGKYPRPRNI